MDFVGYSRELLSYLEEPICEHGSLTIVTIQSVASKLHKVEIDIQVAQVIAIFNVSSSTVRFIAPSLPVALKNIVLEHFRVGDQTADMHQDCLAVIVVPDGTLHR